MKPSSSVSPTPTLIAAFTSDRLALCANVRELHGSNEFEVAVIDALTGGVIVSQTFSTKEAAIEAAQFLAKDLGGS